MARERVKVLAGKRLIGTITIDGPLLGMLAAVEHGYKACERGDNLQKALADARQLLAPRGTRPAATRRTKR